MGIEKGRIEKEKEKKEKGREVAYVTHLIFTRVILAVFS
jgi:hypothetical protein